MKTFIIMLYLLALVNFGFGVFTKNTYYVCVAIMYYLIADGLKKL